MLNKYIQSFWASFTALPGKDFGDISYLWGIYNNVSYYYCVAYVGDNTYMRWYPKATSPVCGGQFCGMKKTTTAEFIQVIINILAKYIYKDINLNRKEVNTRVTSLKTDSYEAKNFTTNDKKIITDRSKSCNNICTLQNANEVNLYLKYCMFNLTKCNMQVIGKIKQWTWPIAELNLLYSQNIIDIDQSQRTNIDKAIDGKTVLETLFKLNGKVNCAFNNDYDCDGIMNAQDNCPNSYNSHQTDTDHDGIGDVCDDDIDEDTIKNPIGIVDDNGNINIKSLIGRTGTLDNCIFVVNIWQEDTNHDGIWDACETIGNQIGLYIDIDKLEWSAPVTTTFTAVSKGEVNEVDRDFGDGTQGKWSPITHTFLLPGTYNVQATAKGNNAEANAQVIVVIGWQIGDDKSMQARASIIWWKGHIESTISPVLAGDFDEIERIFERENSSIKKTANETIHKIFTTSGENPVLIKWYKNGELVGISYFTIGIDEGKWTLLRSNISDPEVNERILLDTNTYNISQSDIVSVNRDFWDGAKKSNTTLTMEYAYTKPGKKIITQTITFTDWSSITDIITINIKDKTLLASYALVMIPSSLVTSIGQKINFNIHIVGTFLKTPLLQTIDFADGNSQTKTWIQKMPSMFAHAYQQHGSLTPQESMAIDQCTYLKDQVTIAVNWNDRCLDGRLQGTLHSLYKCDMDKDGIPDICSDDIDGDGVPNLLWLIQFENKDCSYESNPDTSNANLNQWILAQHYKWICSLDNAPFTPNPDQLDLNQDGIGDAQKTTLTIGSGQTITDTDGDGVSDIQDLCPTIQGPINNNGCPDIGQDLWCNQQWITPLLGMTNDIIIVKPTTCNQCPCQFWDFASDLTNNDQIRAILRDNKKTIQYKLSLPWIVDF